MDNNTHHLLELTELYEYNQLIKEPTRITSSSSTLIYLFLTNEPNNFRTAGVNTIGISDHNLIYAVRKHLSVKSKLITIQCRNYKGFNESNFKRDIESVPFLQSILWPEIFAQSQSCEDMANFFYDIVSIGLDLLMPIKRIKKISADVPWMTDKLKTFIKKRQEAFFSYGPKYNCFKYYRNIVNRERKACKSKYYTTQVHSKEKDNLKLGGVKSNA